MLFTQCDYPSSEFTVGNDKDIATLSSWKSFTVITDYDDQKKLSEMPLSMLKSNNNEIETSIEAIYLKKKSGFSRENTGVNVGKFNLPFPYILDTKNNLKSAFGLLSISDTSNIQQYTASNNTEIVLIRKNIFYKDSLTEILALLSNDILVPHKVFFIQCYAEKEKFDKYTPIFEALIKNAIFDKNFILEQAKTNENGFFKGLQHGLFFPIRLVYSFYDFIDIYADNSDSGYLWGYLIGLILVALLGRQLEYDGTVED